MPGFRPARLLAQQRDRVSLLPRMERRQRQSLCSHAINPIANRFQQGPATAVASEPTSTCPAVGPVERLLHATLLLQHVELEVAPRVAPRWPSVWAGVWYSAAQLQDVLPAVHTIGAKLVRSPSPIDSSSAHVTPHLSCKLGQKRRVSSLDSDVEHSYDEQEHEMPESVERDGMILGMKVEDYRALRPGRGSASETGCRTGPSGPSANVSTAGAPFLHASVVHYPLQCPPRQLPSFLLFPCLGIEYRH